MPHGGRGGGAATRLHEVEALLIGEPQHAIDWQRVHAALMEAIRAPEDDFRSTRYRRGGGQRYGARPRRPPAAQEPTALARHPLDAHAVPGEIALSRQASGDCWHIRPDGPAKIAGRLTYLTDVRKEGMLVARILRAGVPHARIIDIDTSEAEALPGVAAVVTHRDVKGSNGFGIVIQDQPAMCFDKVRYVGDAVAAVAAVDAETAARALALIKVRYEPLPVVSDPLKALEAGAPAVHSAGNLRTELYFERGDVATGFAEAAHVVEAIYETPRQMHGFMETEGGHAFVDEGGMLNVCAGGQHGRRDRMQLSRILALPGRPDPRRLQPDGRCVRRQG